MEHLENQINIGDYSSTNQVPIAPMIDQEYLNYGQRQHDPRAELKPGTIEWSGVVESIDENSGVVKMK